MIRYPEWESRLRAYVKGKDNAPFSWGDNDCSLFVAGAVHAMTGEDLGEPARGKYTTALGAYRWVKKQGYDSVEDMAEQLIGRPVPIGFAQIGDVVSFMTEDNPALGICVGINSVFVKEEEGLIVVPNHMLNKAWRV